MTSSGGAASEIEASEPMSSTSKVSTDKNRNYAVLAGVITGFGALGWYLKSRAKKPEEVQDWDPSRKCCFFISKFWCTEIIVNHTLFAANTIYFLHSVSIKEACFENLPSVHISVMWSSSTFTCSWMACSVHLFSILYATFLVGVG